MNIFVLHESPRIAAQMACDRHVVKMIVESAQMMATIHHGAGSVVRYKPTHPHHPCTLWAGSSAHNYAWLLAHAKALCGEYTYRYGRVHKTEQYIYGELHALPPNINVTLGQTPFAQTMPDECKDPNPVIAYRNFYLKHKAAFATWKQRDVPLWFQYARPELTL